MTEDEDFAPDDTEVSELESEELTDRELASILESQSRPDTPEPDDEGVS
jgi:hypothetical protein